MTADGERAGSVGRTTLRRLALTGEASLRGLCSASLVDEALLVLETDGGGLFGVGGAASKISKSSSEDSGSAVTCEEDGGL